jgi:NitT/TauT family transport system ATP-binding protein
VVTLLPDPGRVHGVLDTRFDATTPVDERRGSQEFAALRHELWRLVHGHDVRQRHDEGEPA